jgi:hypothetical protein
MDIDSSGNGEHGENAEQRIASVPLLRVSVPSKDAIEEGGIGRRIS